MQITSKATIAVAGMVLMAGVALIPTLAAQTPEVRLPGQRVFLPVGANGPTAWVIDVHAQRMIACTLEGDARNSQVSCKSATIP